MRTFGRALIQLCVYVRWSELITPKHSGDWGRKDAFRKRSASVSEGQGSDRRDNIEPI